MGLSTFDAFKHLKAEGAIPLEGERLVSLQRRLVSILDDILAVAQETGARLVLGGGTALGAVRHKGFIPWDDDLDVNMPRADWPRFRDAFMARFGEKYAIFEPGAPRDYGLCFPRIRLRGTSFVTREDLVNPPACPGVFVDVFLSEAAPDNPVLRRLHGLGSLALGFLYSCRKAFAERRWHRKWGLKGGAFRVKRIAGFFVAFASLGFKQCISVRFKIVYFQTGATTQPTKLCQVIFHSPHFCFFKFIGHANFKPQIKTNNPTSTPNLNRTGCFSSHPMCSTTNCQEKATAH